MDTLVSIVYGNSADRVERFAAAELAKYVSAITNEYIPVIKEGGKQGSIYVGQLPEHLDSAGKNQIAEAHRGLPNDGFVIKSINGNLAICGKTPLGTLYGVYHYLQALGVRWYFPGEDYEFLPQLSQIELEPIFAKESPDVTKRGIVIHFQNSALKDWVDFAPKVKLNTIALHSHEGIDEMIDLLADNGLSLDLEVHFFGAEYGSADSTDLAKNMDSARDYVSKLPDCINHFFLWQADGWLQQDDHDKKRGYTMSDSVLQFMNEILTTIKSVRPNSRLAFLAYAGTWQRPQFVEPVDGIFLEIAPIHRCFAHAISDLNCPINSRDVPETLAERRATGVQPVIEELLEVFPPHEAQVLGYWLDASLFGRGRYRGLRGRLPQFGEIIKDDINYYRNLGINAITTFAVGINREYLDFFTSPAIFQYAHLLWNSQADLQAEMVDFCGHIYGEKEMARVFQLREQFDPNDATRQYWEKYLEELASARALTRQVLNDTKDEKIQGRLKKLMDEIDFVDNWVRTNALSIAD